MDSLIDMVDRVLEQSPLKPYSGYNGCFGYAGTPSCTCPKPFAKTERKIVTMTIEESGNAVFLATDSADIFLEMGTVITRRASHVEPAPRYERWLFNLLRILFPDNGKVAAWTRTWNTLWRVNTKPVGGLILTWGHVGKRSALRRMAFTLWGDTVAVWASRQDAIDAEVKFLNEWFVERGI